MDDAVGILLTCLVGLLLLLVLVRVVKAQAREIDKEQAARDKRPEAPLVTSGSFFCYKCGRPMDQSDSFCRSCGAAATRPPS